MNLYDLLSSRQVRLTEIPKWGNYLRGQWEYGFANHLSQEEKEAIFLHDANGACGYLWHLFSYEKTDCYTNNEAESAFDLVEKDSCYVFYQHSDYALIIEDASQLKANLFNNEEDIYIVDKQFHWTFVRTHESYLGPYFCQRKDR